VTKVEEKSPVAAKLRVIVDETLPAILGDLMRDEKLPVEQRANLTAQVTSAMRILRTTLLQLTA